MNDDQYDTMCYARRQRAALYPQSLYVKFSYEPRDWIYKDIQVGGKCVYECTLEELDRALLFIGSSSFMTAANVPERERLLRAIKHCIEKRHKLDKKKSMNVFDKAKELEQARKELEAASQRMLDITTDVYSNTYLGKLIKREQEFSQSIIELSKLRDIAISLGHNTTTHVAMVSTIDSMRKDLEHVREDIKRLKGLS